MALFLKILLTEFIAEMGDKTQLMLVALTSRYKIRDIVIGTAAAVLVLNGIAVLTGGLISELIPTWLIRLIAAAAFLFFALTSLKGDDEEEEKEEEKGKFRFAPLTIFCTFFVAELGDKTQLTAVTFGANEGLNSALIVWLACSIGLFAADISGMLIGYFLKNKLADGVLLNLLAFVIFSVFGMFTLRQGLQLLFGISSEMIWPIIAVVIILYVLFVFRITKTKKGINKKWQQNESN